MSREYTLKSHHGHYNPLVDYDKELNPEQLEVVLAEKGPLLVIAGAGSGKTRTVTYRVARLIEQGIDTNRILLVTFTNKAAREMVHRVDSLIRAETKRLWGGTFHHIGNMFLRRYAKALGYENTYTILDREDSKDLLNSCIAELGINSKKRRFPKAKILGDIISLSVNTGSTIEDIILKKYPFFSEDMGEIIKVAGQYSINKKRLNLMDFDDLLFNWKCLLEQHPEIKDKYCERFQHILVDEYQDTNKIQADVIDLLASLHRNIMVVGDDSQSIYSFRGANFANIIEFPRRYPDAEIFKLEINYRSIPEILHLANSSITHNCRQFPKRLKAIRKSGPKPALVSLTDVMQQADFVAERILELRDENDLSLNEMSVLYRAHYHSMELQMELTRRGIPFEVRSGLRFFEQAHIKDVIGFLRVVVNPFDELSWKRTLKLFPGVGKTTADKIWKFVSSTVEPMIAIDSTKMNSMISKKAGSNLERFRKILGKIKDSPIKDFPAKMIRIVMDNGYKDYLQDTYPNFDSRIEDLNQLENYSLQYRSTETFLSELALLTDLSVEQATVDVDDDERITLSSVHQAKGLEWKVVFVIWCLDGRFPSSRNLGEQDGEEEERRLFYVAATRAMDELYLCCPLMDYRNNQRGVLMKPSRFIRELEESSYEKWTIR